MNGFVDLDAVTRQAESEWAEDASVRSEFGRKDAYLAYRRAEARGLSARSGRAATVSIEATVVQTLAPGQFDAEWAGDAELRAEFGGNKDAYTALRRAETEGRVKTLAPRTAQPQRQQVALPQPQSGPSGQGDQGASNLAQRQAQIRQENVGRRFAGLPELPIPQE
ncbi:MAG: hypothetical protein Q8R06_09660 [Polaromonas sp.]|uniref:hypothetical protein n=1 Tax=Polaromonas sp. TaxID=1869339 RepID=UPI002737116D|nr:hypothetical protein [Polaromonas sp.]MDP3797401.1 hypothetical protein [Polaromonas sp.]